MTKWQRSTEAWKGCPQLSPFGRDGHITRFVEGLVGHHEVEQNIKQALATSATGPKQAVERSSRSNALVPPQGKLNAELGMADHFGRHLPGSDAMAAAQAWCTDL